MPQLSYRDLNETDLDAIHAIGSHWSVVRQLGSWPWPPDRAFTQSRCKPYEGSGFVWAICLDGTVCGSVAVTGRELGYALDPSVANQGIMSQATHHAVEHAFSTMDIPCLNAGIWFDNAPSRRVLVKLGFQHWQSRFEHALARGFPVQSHYFRLQRADWTA